jgi:aminoglycoside phosphotransferase (APT) family kinase protein
MIHQWTAEQLIEPNLALEIIQEQFPALHAQYIALLGVGWDNTAFLINDAIIFRFPRRQIALPLLEAEMRSLPIIAPKVPLAVPVPEWIGKPAKTYPWPFMGYRALPGMTACHAELSDSERMKIAPILAQFLRALHSIPLSVSQDCALPCDLMEKLNCEKLIPKIKKNLEDLTVFGLIDKELDFSDFLTKEFSAPEVSAIVHGDFYIRHLLVNEAHELTGVIDWGDIHIGDPAVDLSIVHSFLPTDAHRLFRSIYGTISEETWQLARLRALYSSSMLVLYGHHSKDRHLTREGLHSLNQIQKM